MKVVDDVPIINLNNSIMVNEVTLDVVTEGLARLLRDAVQIPSSFGTWASYLVVLDEGGAEVLPAVDGASREHLAAHHHGEVGCHDVIVAAGRAYCDRVGA